LYGSAWATHPFFDQEFSPFKQKRPYLLRRILSPRYAGLDIIWFNLDLGLSVNEFAYIPIVKSDFKIQ